MFTFPSAVHSHRAMSPMPTIRTRPVANELHRRTARNQVAVWKEGSVSISHVIVSQMYARPGAQVPCRSAMMWSYI